MAKPEPGYENGEDRERMEVIGTIIGVGAPGSAPGKGLPIGNLTSFARDRLDVDA